jgi:hypothetical protein
VTVVQRDYAALREKGRGHFACIRILAARYGLPEGIVSEVLKRPTRPIVVMLAVLSLRQKVRQPESDPQERRRRSIRRRRVHLPPDLSAPPALARGATQDVDCALRGSCSTADVAAAPNFSTTT